MIALLKQKSKITIEQKPRKTYEVENMFKRAKIDEDLTQEQRDQAAQALGLSGTRKTSRKILDQQILKDLIWKFKISKPNSDHLWFL